MVKIFLLLFTFLWLNGCKTNPPTNPPLSFKEYGQVYISCNVDSALIFIDNVSTGKYTPDTITSTVGVHIFKLEKENYKPEIQSIAVLKDSLISVVFTLKLSQAEKIVLLEDFANVSCAPCVTSNKILESIRTSYGYKKVLMIKFPTNFPSPSDPFYLANTSDCNSRMSYYNVLVAPTIKVDGILSPTPTDSNSIKQRIEQRILQIPKFKLTVNDSLDTYNYNIKISLETIDTMGVDFNNLVLHTVVVESVIEFATPPGSNGETKFHDVMRKMLPSSSGEVLSYSPSGFQTFTRQVSLNSNWNSSKLETIVFVQNKVTKEVLQASSTYN